MQNKGRIYVFFFFSRASSKIQPFLFSFPLSGSNGQYQLKAEAEYIGVKMQCVPGYTCWNSLGIWRSFILGIGLCL